MGSLPLLAPLNASRDRAMGLLYGAVVGAQAARRASWRDQPSPDWPSAEAVVLHTGDTLLETGDLDPKDLLRRLIQQWARDVGRPRLVHAGQGVHRHRHQPTTGGWTAALAPVAILRLTDRKTAQFEAAQWARAINAPTAEVEAMELASLFLRRALMAGRTGTALEPLHWEGDARVAAVAGGHSLPLDTNRDLVAAVDQAFVLAKRQVSLTTAVAALATIHASDAAFILTAMLIGALDGRGAFVGQAAFQSQARLAGALEILGDALLARQPQDHRAQPTRVHR
jgi:hypothetical protein